LLGTNQPDIHQLLLSVVRSLVDDPDVVEVEWIDGEEATFLRVEANASDVGRLIGRNGQTARALEIIVNAGPQRSGRRIHIEIDRRAGNRPQT
jgi:predicted RNA-binding protein YlqC (UPF0109 family)